MVDFVCECELCGSKDYRFNATQNQLDLLRGISDKGLFHCFRCNGRGSNMKIKQLKWKDIQKLHAKFPNKKALFTKKTVEEILNGPNDLTPEPNLAWETQEV